MKKNKGITLIALVITIVIMLILAGVTLNAALGENGLFKRAKQAVEEHKKAEETEQETMREYESQLDSINAGKKTDIPEKWGTDAKDKVEAVEGGVDSVIPVPKGFYYAGGTISDGFVISDVPGDDLDNSKHGNQFVWIPCTVEQYDDADGVNVKQNWIREDNYMDCADSSTVLMKNGTGDGKGWRDDFTEEDINHWNEFLNSNVFTTTGWIPGNNVSEDRESISKYGGFYIGRFEAGIPESLNFSKKNSNRQYLMSDNKPPFAKARDDWNQSPWVCERGEQVT